MIDYCKARAERPAGTGWRSEGEGVRKGSACGLRLRGKDRGGKHSAIRVFHAAGMTPKAASQAYLKGGLA